MLDGRAVYTSGSIGVLLPGQLGDTAEDVMRDADAAMHAAKRRGKARSEVFDASHARERDRPVRARGRPAAGARDRRARPLLPADRRDPEWFGSDLRLSVHLSVAELDQTDLVEDVSAALAEAGADPSTLCLETPSTRR